MIDPNVIYMALVLGLWMGVTAIYMPGTGIAEVLALLGVGGAVFALISLPTNWFAVILLVIGVLSFMIVPFVRREYAPLALLGLVLQGIGGWVLFYDGTQVSPVLIALTLVIPLGYHQWILLPMLDKARTQPVIDKESTLIGARGRVVKALDPTGTINVQGELWTATSDQPLPPGAEVVVLEREGLAVIVEKVKEKHSLLEE